MALQIVHAESNKDKTDTYLERNPDEIKSEADEHASNPFHPPQLQDRNSSLHRKVEKVAMRR